MKKIPIIMDVDTGVDDAIAILLAATSDEIDLRGITTVAGNQTLKKTSRNTLQVLEMAGRTDIPVASGADRPIRRKLRTAGNVHGREGLGNVTLPAPKTKLYGRDAAALQKKLIEECSEKITIVATGPLTNIAILLRSYPHLKDRIEKIVLMGGGSYNGNTTPMAEFNMLEDPEADKIVFCSEIPIVMCGLDVTMKAAMRKPDIDRLKGHHSMICDFASKELSFYSKVYEKYENWEGGCAVHDAVTIAYLIKPDLMKGNMAPVEVDLSEGPAAGCTVVDMRPGIKGGNVLVLDDIDRERFTDLLCTRLESYR